MSDENKKTKIRLIDRFTFFLDQTYKRFVTFFYQLALLLRAAWKLDKSLLSSFTEVFYTLLKPIEGPAPLSTLLNIVRVLLGTVLAAFTFVIIIIVLLIGGTLSGIFGFRNKIQYSFKEQLAAWVCLLALLACLPIWIGPYTLFKVCTLLSFIVIVCGLDFLYGQCGILSLGHAAFVLLGGYFTTWFYTGVFGFQLPYIFACFIAATVTAVIGAGIGLVSLRIKDQYLVVITLVFGVTVPKVLQSKYLAKYSGVREGGLPIEQPFQYEALQDIITAETLAYFVTVGLFLLMIIFAYNIIHHSQIGRAFKTIKCDVEVSSIIGVPVLRYKVYAFALSAFYAAIAGGMLMLATKMIGPESYVLEDSVQYKIALVLGGAGSILGSVFGGMYIAFEPNVAEWMASVVPRGDKLTHGLSGALLVFAVYFVPRGIAGELVLFFKRKFLTPPRRGQYRMNPPTDYDYLKSTKTSPTSTNETRAKDT